MKRALPYEDVIIRRNKIDQVDIQNESERIVKEEKAAEFHDLAVNQEGGVLVSNEKPFH